MTDNSQRGLDAIKATQARRTEFLDQRVLDMIAQMVEDPSVMPVHITAGRIARQLGNVPTRQTIAKKPHLVEAMQRAQKEKEKRLRNTPKDQNHSAGSTSAMRSEIKTYQAQLQKMQNEIAKLRTANTDLEQQRRLALGAQLEGSVLVDPEQHQKVVRDNIQLVDENQKAYGQIRELEKTVKAMERTLKAQRAASAKLLEERTPDDPNKVVTLRAEKGTKKKPSTRKRTDDQ
ncbi:MAG: hypothetical protein HQ526_08310 [Actinobacteria bacterium]|nr:hypothetical protein [Actinomycetota bacterium]